MTRTLKAVAYLSLLTTTLGATGEGCGKVKTDRPPQDRVVDPAHKRTVQIRVTEATGPYTVFVIVREPGTPGTETSRETVAGGQYRQTVSYTSGLRLEILMHVNGHPGDQFECELVDGPGHKDKQRSAGGVLCTLVTSR